MPVWALLRRLPWPCHLRARRRGRPPQGCCSGGVGHAAIVHRRAPLRRPGQLLPQVCAALLSPGSSPDCPVQPARPVRVGRRRAAELRRAQGCAHIGARASRVGPGAPDAPAHRRLRVGRLLHPGAAGRRWCLPPRRVRVAQTDSARAFLPAPHAGAAGGGARAQDAAAVPPRQALRAAHGQRKPPVAAAAAPRQPPPGALAQPSRRVPVPGRAHPRPNQPG